MADQSYAIRRNHRQVDVEFPTHPVLGLNLPCMGVILVGQDASDLPVLGPVRESLRLVLEGALQTCEGEVPLLVALFAAPTDIAALNCGRILPISPTQGRDLVSFAMDAAGPTVQVPIEGPDPRQLDLWWSGKRHTVMLPTLRRVSLAGLWQLPEVRIHAPLRDASAHEKLRDEKVTDTPLKSAPKQAAFPQDGAYAFPIDDALERDLALDHRTSIRAIFAQIWRRIQGQDSAEGGTREPGVLTNIVGWVLWHTPMGIPLARQMAHRVRLVERLMAAGDVDSALRLALQLGSPNGSARDKKIYPLRLPGMRKSLDFNFNRGGGSAPILGVGQYTNLHAQYHALAQRMENEGDFKRAAYIRAQLQGNYHAAAETLARGKLFLDAAKLALEAKLQPAFTIALFYKAGEKHTALAIAKRSECFEQLAETSRKDDAEFHAFVLRAWTDRLVETGQPLRALQVTDALAYQDAANVDLTTIRLKWIDMALNDATDDAAAPEGVVRALLWGDWPDDDAALASFALGKPIQGAGRNAISLSALDHWMRQRPALISDILILLVRFANANTVQQSQFWRTAAPIVVERMALTLANTCEAQISQQDKGDLVKLLRMAGLEVLATDWGRLRFQPGGAKPGLVTWRLPPTKSRAAAAVHGCILANDTIVVWRETGLLQLYDIYGRTLWQGKMSMVSGLVPLGTSGDVLILQPTLDGHQISRFSTKTRRFTPIGVVALTTWHDITTDGQWLVQWEGRIGAFDLSQLCAATPEFEFLWSCHLSDNMRVMAFVHDTGRPEWLTIDVSDSRRNGMIEAWALVDGQKLVNWIWDIEPDRPLPPGSDQFWIWQGQNSCRMIGPAQWSITIKPWSEQSERQSIAQLNTRRKAAPDSHHHILSCDQYRMAVERQASGPNHTPALLCSTRGHKRHSLSIEHDLGNRLTCLARGNGRGGKKGDGIDRSHLALIGADDGRLVA